MCARARFREQLCKEYEQSANLARSLARSLAKYPPIIIHLDYLAHKSRPELASEVCRAAGRAGERMSGFCSKMPATRPDANSDTQAHASGGICCSRAHGRAPGAGSGRQMALAPPKGKTTAEQQQQQQVFLGGPSNLPWPSRTANVTGQCGATMQIERAN